MTDEQTPDDQTSDEPTPHANPAVDQPTAETPTTGATTEIAPPPPPPPAPETTAAPEAPAKSGRYVRVPAWLLVVLAAVVLAGGSFALGRVTADTDDGPREIRVGVPERVTPEVPDGETPQVPNLNDAFLGVATQRGDGGAEVLQVAPGSPADDAGIKTGDVITQVDGDAIEGPTELRSAIGEHDPGDEITITYERDGEERDTSAELVERSEAADETPPN